MSNGETPKASARWSMDEYIEKRVVDQLKYYDSKSGKFKLLYDFGTIGALVLGVLIQLVLGDAVHLGFIEQSHAGQVLSGVVTILGGLLTHKRAKESHLAYREMCEWIRSEQSMFLRRAGDYYALDDANAENQFVVRFETAIKTEVKGFKQAFSNDTEVVKTKAAVRLR